MGGQTPPQMLPCLQGVVCPWGTAGLVTCPQQVLHEGRCGQRLFLARVCGAGEALAWQPGARHRAEAGLWVQRARIGPKLEPSGSLPSSWGTGCLTLKKVKEARGSTGMERGGGGRRGGWLAQLSVTREPKISSPGGLVQLHKLGLCLVLLPALPVLLTCKSHPESDD